MAVSTQGFIEQYQYHRNIKALIANKDSRALQKLISADCGGGAGCYDHGKTLVQILIKIGDKEFSKLIYMLSKKDKEHLYSLFAVGHEYGGFTQYPDWEGFKDRYLLTFSNFEKGYNGAFH